MIEELKAKAQHQYLPGNAIATIYGALGERDQAFAWLEKAYEQRTPGLGNLKSSPEFDSLRADPRFADLLRRMGFPP